MSNNVSKLFFLDLLVNICGLAVLCGASLIKCHQGSKTNNQNISFGEVDIDNPNQDLSDQKPQ
jgi:hypothetical protein